MRTRLISLCLFVGLCGCNSLSLPPPIAVVGGPQAEEYPDSPAVVLSDEATLEYRVMESPDGGGAKLVAVLDHYRRIKLLRAEGRKEASLVLPLDGLSSVADVIGRSIDRHGFVSPLKTRNISVHRPNDHATHAPEVRQLVAHLPDAEPGGTVEFRYQRVYLDPWNVPVWTYGGHLPVLHATFGLVTDDGIDVDFLHGKGDEAVERAPSERDRFGSKPRLKFIETHLPPYFSEPDGTHLAHRSPWTLPALRVARLGNGHVERMNGWKDAARHVLNQMAFSEPKASRAPLPDRFAYLRKTLVPENGYGLGVRAPQAAAALELGTPACTRDASGFAKGLLQDFEKDVDVVLLTGPQAPPFSETFVSLAVFRRAALRLGMQAGLSHGLACDGPGLQRDYLCGAAVGSRIYFQPGCPTCGIGTLAPGMAGSRALVINAAGEVNWTDVDIGGPERHVLNQNLTYRLDVDGSLRGTLQASAHGQVAGHWREALRLAEEEGPSNQSAIEDVHYAQLFGDGDGPRASGLKATFLKKPEQKLNIEAVLSALLHPASTAGEAAQLRAKDVFGTSFPSTWRRSRQDALVMGGPRWHEMTAQIEVPLRFSANLPPPTKVVTSAFEYAAGFSQKGRTLHYGRRLVVKAPYVSQHDWPAVFDGIEQVRAAESRPLPVRF